MHLAKLTAARVFAIRNGHRRGVSQALLAEAFGVTVPTVGCVIRGKTWKHLPPALPERFENPVWVRTVLVTGSYM